MTALAELPEAAAPDDSPLRRNLRLFASNRLALLSSAVVLAVVLMAVLVLLCFSQA